MRYFRRQPRVRVYCRVDKGGPLRQAVHVAGRDLESPDKRRLAEAVVSARERLRVTQEEFAELAGLSLTTIQRVEQKLITPRTKTFSGLDQGAGWVQGSARAVYRDGRAPVSIASGPEAELAARRAAELAEVEGEIQNRLIAIGEIYGLDAMRLAAERLGQVIKTETDRLSRRTSSDVTHRD